MSVLGDYIARQQALYEQHLDELQFQHAEMQAAFKELPRLAAYPRAQVRQAMDVVAALVAPVVTGLAAEMNTVVGALLTREQLAGRGDELLALSGPFQLKYGKLLRDNPAAIVPAPDLKYDMSRVIAKLDLTATQLKRLQQLRWLGIAIFAGTGFGLAVVQLKALGTAVKTALNKLPGLLPRLPDLGWLLYGGLALGGIWLYTKMRRRR